MWEPGEERDTTTPAAAARTFTELTTGKTLHDRDRGRLVGWLKASLTGTTRIRAGLPDDWTVDDKTGTANDVAIVWTPGSKAPMIMSVFTNRNVDDTPHDDKVIASTATARPRSPTGTARRHSAARSTRSRSPPAPRSRPGPAPTACSASTASTIRASATSPTHSCRAPGPPTAWWRPSNYPPSAWLASSGTRNCSGRPKHTPAS